MLDLQLGSRQCKTTLNPFTILILIVYKMCCKICNNIKQIAKMLLNLNHPPVYTFHSNRLGILSTSRTWSVWLWSSMSLEDRTTYDQPVTRAGYPLFNAGDGHQFGLEIYPVNHPAIPKLYLDRLRQHDLPCVNPDTTLTNLLWQPSTIAWVIDLIETVSADNTEPLIPTVTSL